MGTNSPITFHRGIGVTTSGGAKRRLANLNNTQGPKITRWLHDTWNAQGNDLRLEDIANALDSGSIGPKMLSNWRESYIDYVGKQAEAWKVASKTSGDFVMDGLFKSGALRSPVDFDLANDAMSHYFQNRGTQFVNWASDTQREGVNFLLDYFTTQKPLTVDEMGRVLRASVGLNKTQQKSLAKFTDELKAIRPKLTNRQITSKVFKREAKMVAARAKAIAKNEISNAYNAATRESYRQAMESAALSPEFAGMIPVKIWDASPACCQKVCCPLHGEAVQMDETFSDGSEAPPAHVRCDCVEVTGLMTPEELGLTAEENRAISEAA